MQSSEIVRRLREIGMSLDDAIALSHGDDSLIGKANTLFSRWQIEKAREIAATRVGPREKALRREMEGMREFITGLEKTIRRRRK